MAKDLNSELLKLVQQKVQTFVDNNEGRLPEDAEWNQLIEIDSLMDAANGPLSEVNNIHRNRLNQEMEAQAPGEFVAVLAAAAKKKHLELMQYESQIAAFLLFHAEGHPGFAPNELKKLFVVRQAPSLGDILRSNDPLANIDPNDLSPPAQFPSAAEANNVEKAWTSAVDPDSR